MKRTDDWRRKCKSGKPCVCRPHKNRREAARFAWDCSRADDKAALSAQQFKLTEEANHLQREVISKERNKSEATSMHLTTYGNTLKNSITKMFVYPIELVFFDLIEHMYKELGVPQSLQVILLKPYLNERASVLVNRLTGDLASDYRHVESRVKSGDTAVSSLTSPNSATKVNFGNVEPSR